MTAAPLSHVAFASPLPPVAPIGTASPTETPPPCAPAWRVSSSSNTGPDDNVFNAVAAISVDDAWVVGFYSMGNLAQTLTMHWDGKSWVPVPSPNRGSSTNILTAVVAISSSDVWAVGHYFNGNVTDSLTMHWDGTSWQVASSPNIGSVGNFLTAVSAPPRSGGRDVWAVGQSYDGSSFLTLIEHWDGTQWSIVPSPSPGQYDNRLRGVTATSSNDAWTVGYYYVVDSYLTLTMHWDGSSWGVMASPNVVVGTNYLRAVSALSPRDVWAVGNYSQGGFGPYQTLTMHWNGTQWDLAPSPNPGATNNYLRSVQELSSNDAWAVGNYDGDVGQMNTLALHWDGAGWSVAPSPNPGIVNQFYGVSAVSGSDAWAVGIWDSTGPYQTLVEHYSDPCASPTLTPAPPSPTAAGTATPTNPPTYTRTPVSTATSTATATAQVTITSTPTLRPTATATSSACAITFSDVHPGDYFYEPVVYLYCHRVILGYGDGTFKPYNLTTRGQLSKIVVLAEGWTIYAPSTPTFRDVPAADPFYTYIETAYGHGIVSGYDCGPYPEGAPHCLEFRPGNNVTRGQLCKIVVLAKGWPTYTPTTPTFRDVPATDPFYPRIETAYYHAIISGYDCGPVCLEFRPGNNATRGQISKIVYQAVTQP